jgi:hypothetical protein
LKLIQKNYTCKEENNVPIAVQKRNEKEVMLKETIVADKPSRKMTL